MEIGDILEIKGNLGFLSNPIMKIVDKKGDLVKVISIKRIDDNLGVLSHLNASWYSIDLLKDKLK